jgi:hypothetical protein
VTDRPMTWRREDDLVADSGIAEAISSLDSKGLF